MALSMPNPPTIWDRTLPKPAALLPNGFQELPRRNSSLLQHHIGSDQFLTPAANDSGRRSTVAFLPVRPEAEKEKVPGEEDFSTQRSGSVMSNGSITTSSSEGTSPRELSSDYCLCVPEPKIPRPRNAFILYRQHQHVGVVAQHPGLPNPEVSKIIGEQWRQLPSKDKNEWKALAEQEKARHSQQFPDYRYRPKRSRRFQSQEGLPSNRPQASNCAKCGGRTMNPPHIPHYTSFDHNGMVPIVGMPRPQKRGYSEAHAQPPRAPPIVQVAPPPYTAPMRYGFGSVSAPRHDSIHYAAPLSHVPAEGPDAKKRRLNSPYPTRPPYDVPYYSEGRDRPMYRPEQLPRQPMPPPPIRASHPTPPPQAAPRGPPSIQQRRDPNLTLPPLKTGSGQPRSATSPKTQSQAPSMEAMIMSYPVLTKLKTLSSITPILAAPGPSSPPFEVRGTVIAIEGLDQTRVFDMTYSLAEQLEKAGKFAVRIFTGPDPYHALQTSRRASFGEKGGEFMTAAKYLSLMSEWHRVSKDLIDFITHRPRIGTVENVTDRGITDAMQDQSIKRQDQSPFESEQNKSRRSSISAVSPSTIEQTADMSIDTPQIGTASLRDKPSTSFSATRVTRSRIPASQKDTQYRQEDTQPLLRNTSEAISSPVLPPPSSHPPTTPPLPPSATPSPKTTKEPQPLSQPQTSLKIPIALISHYQLTTVDTCSIALPITDNYDHLTHWRWHATLWRGCVGPDVSIVIKSPHEQHEDDTAGPSNPDAKRQSNASDVPGRTGSVAAAASGTAAQPRVDEAQSGGSQDARPPPPPPFGVEVRLQDHRAVIVRAAAGRNGAGVSEDEREKENENWEKAKRRVGFEVEESLRR